MAEISPRSLRVDGFSQVRSRRGDKGRNDRKFLEAPWILEPSATELYVNRICTSLPSSLI